MSVLISVVIPTRTRAETLGATLRSAVEQDFGDYEIIVCDNNSEDNTREVIESLGSNKIRYFNTGKRLSMCDNWEFALSHAEGEYIIFIGDDDAIIPGALNKLQTFIQKNPAPAYKWPVRNIYTYPNRWPKGICYLFVTQCPSP
ncbi:glycosyltransferase family 2 protein [Desulfosporosinus sp.]|uniref:glycosyltransferase family 2 protein n=1 Tax=Desulfosporosinus sp. TaxID=157907 RepID=UPI002631E2EA|nr:glycosyltransferase family 2 protein [Desulfosporosinus sp.]